MSFQKAIDLSYITYVWIFLVRGLSQFSIATVNIAIEVDRPVFCFYRYFHAHMTFSKFQKSNFRFFLTRSIRD